MDDNLLKDIDRRFLNKVLESVDLTKLNMMEVCEYIYDATYLKYAQLYHSAKRECDHLTQSVVNLTGKNEDLKTEIDLLKKQLDSV
jgi:ATP phosphoribosyltransferase regulatory subunit HisZ